MGRRHVINLLFVKDEDEFESSAYSTPRHSKLGLPLYFYPTPFHITYLPWNRYFLPDRIKIPIGPSSISIIRSLLPEGVLCMVEHVSNSTQIYAFLGINAIVLCWTKLALVLETSGLDWTLGSGLFFIKLVIIYPSILKGSWVIPIIPWNIWMWRRQLGPVIHYISDSDMIGHNVFIHFISRIKGPVQWIQLVSTHR